MLLYIANEINNQKYGTFLGNCPKDRLALKVVEETESMWTFIFMERVRFSNIHFDQNLKEVIKEIPQVKFQLLKVWRPYFFKWCEFGQAQNMFKNG